MIKKMIKTILLKPQFFLLAVLITVFFSPTFVFARPAADVSLTEALEAIMKNQAVSDPEKIDCQKISEDDLEILGDAVMEKMLGSSEQHEIMDEMMGGQGSASLKAMHKNMGLRYLGCRSNFNNLNFGNSMMGNLGLGSMGWGFWPAFGWVTMILFWVLLVVVIVALVKWLLTDKNKKK